MPEQARKPIYVYHDGACRRYLWSADLLDVTCLGDVIPALENAASGDCAALHLYSHPASPADVIAVDPPTPALWIEVARISAQNDP